MHCVVDRIESGVAVCQCLDSGEEIKIGAGALPPQTREGDVLAMVDGEYVLDRELTEKRRADLTARMNRLFERK